MSGSDLLRAVRHDLPLLRRRLGYGPYLILHSVPWLLLATALRMQARSQHSIAGLALLILVEYALLIAFLLASHRMIQLAGGSVNLERLPFREQSALARAVIGRLLVVFLICVLSMIAIGVHPNYAAVLWLGLDNIVYPWPGRYLPLWSAFIAILVFMMVVEKGLGRSPGFIAAMRQIAARWRHMAIAGLMIAAALYGLGILQMVLLPRLEPLYVSLQLPILKNGLYLFLMFSFSYARLWVTMVILTHALRASYRPADGA